MTFTETTLEGAFVIDLERIEDARGFFARAWCAREFQDHKLTNRVAQCNLAFNKQKWTLRGMHYQVAPHEEAKVIRCTRGAIFDVIIDLRQGSPTYKKWFGVELTSENRKALYVPEGFAHGYQTLEDDTEVFYLVSEFYTSEAERGVRWNDPAFGIEWPEMEHVEISNKDQTWPDYQA
jgi:dTDP-4-dehydrorhamnose 3,5-epimerase